MNDRFERQRRAGAFWLGFVIGGALVTLLILYGAYLGGL